MTLRRYDGEGLGNAIRIVTLLFLTVVASWSGATAQLGHEPSHSPYRDVRRGGVGVLTFGYLGGGRGSVGVGLSDGTTGGIRYEVPFGAVGASLGLAYGRTNRFVVDPTKDSSSPARTSPPVANDVVLIDAGLQLVLTGRKTWRGFAPYVGGAQAWPSVARRRATRAATASARSSRSLPTPACVGTSPGASPSVATSVWCSGSSTTRSPTSSRPATAAAFCP